MLKPLVPLEHGQEWASMISYQVVGAFKEQEPVGGMNAFFLSLTYPIEASQTNGYQIETVSIWLALDVLETKDPSKLGQVVVKTDGTTVPWS